MTEDHHNSQESGRSTFPTLPVMDSRRLLLSVRLATIAQGLVARSDRLAAGITKLNARVDATAGVARRLHGMRSKYGDGPVWLRGKAGHRTLLILSAADLGRVFAESVALFATDLPAKRLRFAPLLPNSVSVSAEPDRANRRRFHEAVLDTGKDTHRLADQFVRVVDEECAELLGRIGVSGSSSAPAELTWQNCYPTCQRVIRRCVLGDAARDDTDITTLTMSLFAAGIWGSLVPAMRLWWKRRADRLGAKLAGYVRRAETGSLVSLIDIAPSDERTDPLGQVPHWILAFQTMQTLLLPALGLLATHPMESRSVSDELTAADRQHGTSTAAGVVAMPLLRACLCEAARLWPAVPFFTRRATTDIAWNPEGAVIPADTVILLPAVLHHRDEERLDFAHAFTPAAWVDGRASEDWSLVPFSRGDARCAGAELALFVGAAILASLLRQCRFDAVAPNFEPGRALPYSLDYLGIRLSARPVTGRT
jgi:cytochrome P450